MSVTAGTPFSSLLAGRTMLVPVQPKKAENQAGLPSREGIRDNSSVNSRNVQEVALVPQGY
jgi:hypothetical protein